MGQYGIADAIALKEQDKRETSDLGAPDGTDCPNWIAPLVHDPSKVSCQVCTSSSIACSSQPPKGSIRTS